MADATTHDLLLRGGTLLDPAQGIHDPRDIAFRGGRVSAVAENIEAGTAVEVVDVSGRLVTPGLIDLHGHFYHGGTTSAVNADESCLPSGVTTGLDAGSAGIANYGSDDLTKISGSQSNEIERLVGRHYGDEAVHRNNMVVL